MQIAVQGGIFVAGFVLGWCVVRVMFAHRQRRNARGQFVSDK